MDRMFESIIMPEYQEQQEFAAKGKIIHHRYPDGYEWWKCFDAEGRVIHRKDSDSSESWTDGTDLIEQNERRE